ncbi:TetR/AcrR family transcriptional regulator [Mycolicibacterium farcinogenes]|uniref:TetR/AcrR family transcriptional regulator n=1 Tax=Mycolicibacterium farcinogenes TaxID=1802 RepID=UPI001FD33AE4|nr:TetR/AcrR family transcriptional regulator [Mycolicibacterium farcinogenes]
MAQEDRRARRSAETRRALVAAARNLFVERGYTAVSTGDIADAAGVTRNSIYYHFPNKESIFRAVYEDVEAELASRVIPAALAEPTAQRQIEVACKVFLDGCLDPAVARVSVLEAPGVLGFEQMREIDNDNYLGVLRQGIRAAIASGEVVALPADTLASMLIGALDEAALLIATATDRDQARKDAGNVARALINGLFTA